MATAARDIPYFDFTLRRQVVVPKGAEIPTDALRMNRCDLDKLARTGYIETAPVGAVPPPKKRGRPKKKQA